MTQDTHETTAPPAWRAGLVTSLLPYTTNNHVAADSIGIKATCRGAIDAIIARHAQPQADLLKRAVEAIKLAQPHLADMLRRAPLPPGESDAHWSDRRALNLMDAVLADAGKAVKP